MDALCDAFGARRQVYVAAASKSGNGSPAPLLGKGGKKDKVCLFLDAEHIYIYLYVDAVYGMS